MNRKNFLRSLVGLPLVALAATNLPAQPALVYVPLPKSTRRSDIERMLRCIAAVETGFDDSKIGRAGERSQYQISRAVWKKYRSESLFHTCRGSTAVYIATAHLEWLDEQLLPQAPFSLSPYWLAIAWNAGLSVALKAAKEPLVPRAHGYAVRVTNLYDELSLS